MEVSNLKAYLANIGMSIKEFADKVECHQKYISTLMSGKNFPSKRLQRDIHIATGGIIMIPLRPPEKRKRKKLQQHQKQEENPSSL